MKLVVLRTAKIRIYFDMTMIKSLFIFLTSSTLDPFTLFSFDSLYLFVFHHYPRILLATQYIFFVYLGNSRNTIYYPIKYFFFFIDV